MLKSIKSKIAIVLIMLFALFISPMTVMGEPNNDLENDELVEPTLKKEAVDINYDDKTIKYEINLNENNQMLESSLLDDFFEMHGLQLKDDSVVVTDVTNSQILTLGTDYDLITEHANGDPFEDGGFNIYFINDYQNFNSHIKVEYLANYNLNDLLAGDAFINNLTLSYRLVNKDYGELEFDETNTKVTVLLDGMPEAHNNHMQKTGERVGDKITWTLLVNHAQTKFEELVVYENWDDQQVLVDNSITVYPMDIDASNNFIPDLNNPLVKSVDYNIIEDPSFSGLEIEFTNETNQAYMIQLETRVDPSLSGELVLENFASTYDRWAESPLVNPEDTASVNYDLRDKSTFVVKKVDVDGSPLEDALLVLVRNNSEDYEEIYTDAFGIAVFSDKLYGTYTLYEAASPEGYNISQEYIDGVEVEISEEVNSDIIALEIVNEKTKVVLSKMNAMEEAINNATFRLEKMTEDGYEIVSEHLLSVNGEIMVRGLSEGKYRFIETKASEGYVRNERKYEFTLTEDEMGNIDDYYLTAINYKGSVELLKTDENNMPLENVVFDLYDQDDNLVKADLKTDKDGKINVEDLAPNTYYFKEKKTVDGYMLDDKLHVFTVEEAALDKPEMDMLTVVNEKIVEKTPQPEDHGELPSTGIDNSTGVFITVISVSVVYIGYVLYRKRKLKQ